jgi:hypothetical protein
MIPNPPFIQKPSKKSKTALSLSNGRALIRGSRLDEIGQLLGLAEFGLTQVNYFDLLRQFLLSFGNKSLTPSPNILLNQIILSSKPINL